MKSVRADDHDNEHNVPQIIQCFLSLKCIDVASVHIFQARCVAHNPLATNN